MRQPTDEHLADGLVALGERAVRLAELLEAAESEAAAIADECTRLGVAERLLPTLTALQRVPSEAAERLQDDLDCIVGELHHPPVTAGDTPAHNPRFPTSGPSHEQLSVVCSACGRHVAAVAVDGTTAGLRLDGRAYRCPHCGHRDRYETWDHFVDEQDNAPT